MMTEININIYAIYFLSYNTSKGSNTVNIMLNISQNITKLIFRNIYE